MIVNYRLDAMSHLNIVVNSCEIAMYVNDVTENIPFLIFCPLTWGAKHTLILFSCKHTQLKTGIVFFLRNFLRKTLRDK